MANRKTRSKRDFKSNNDRDNKPTNSRSSQSESNNYQDKAMEREYDKGKEDGRRLGGKNKRNLRSKTNDPQWYSANVQLLKDAASIPFSWSLGTSVTINFPKAKEPITIPGIMTFRVKSSVGFATSPSSPLNVAATSFYGWVRYANSGSRNYDTPDLMCLVLGMADVYSYINMLQRVYGAAMLYDQRNRYLPRVLVEAMNVDFDDIQNNLANFRYGINALINKASSLAVPANMAYLKRKAFLYQNVYIGGHTIKDQMYMYVPDSFWMVDADVDGSTGLVEKTFWSTTPYTYQQLLEFGNELLQPIVQSEDMNIMSGDILKAYGENNIIKLASLNEDYRILPLYDVYVLEQFKNATVFSEPLLIYQSNVANMVQVDYYADLPTTPTKTCAVYQDPTKAFLMSTPFLKLGSTATQLPTAVVKLSIEAFTMNHLLSTQSDQPTPEMVIESTRLQGHVYTYTPVNYDGKAADINGISAGCEIVTDVSTWTYDYASATAAPTVVTSSIPHTVYQYSGVSLPLSQPISDMGYLLSTLSNYEYHPPVNFVAAKFEPVGGSSTNLVNSENNVVGIGWDFNNYAVITPETLDKMNETALLNLLNTPSIALSK